MYFGNDYGLEPVAARGCTDLSGGLGVPHKYFLPNFAQTALYIDKIPYFTMYSDENYGLARISCYFKTWFGTFCAIFFSTSCLNSIKYDVFKGFFGGLNA